MIRIYLKQAWELLRQNRLFSTIYIIGTGLSIALVMTLFIIFYVKFAPVYPEYNRNRTLVVKASKRYPKGQPQNWNINNGVAYWAVDGLLAEVPHVEAVAGSVLDIWRNYQVSATDVKPFKVVPHYANAAFSVSSKAGPLPRKRWKPRRRLPCWVSHLPGVSSPRPVG